MTHKRDANERIGDVIALQLPAPGDLSARNPEAEHDQAIREARRKYKREYQRARRRGETWKGPGINPETGKRRTGTGLQPTTGVYSPMLKGISNASAPSMEGRFRSRRERANELRERMAACSAIYNAAWLVREAYFGPDERRRRTVEALLRTFADELRKTQDYEAVVFAMVDALYCSPSGVPWEP